MELIQHFSHNHPLVFNEVQSHESHKVYCSACGELVLGPSFSCADCGFYLDKKCSEAPSELNHPFHRNHSLKLLVSPPYRDCFCNFCDKRCDKFVYYCSCGLDFHIKCALLSNNIAEKKFGGLEDSPHKDQLVSKEADCFACRKPLLDSRYISVDFGFYLHKKCVDLPTEINHLSHCQHPLFLQFNSERLPCQICHRIQRKGFVYCCSPCRIALHIACVKLSIKIDHFCHHQHPLVLQFDDQDIFSCQICRRDKQDGFYCCSICKFALHIECALPPPIIEEKSHQHPFILFWKRIEFICDACGTLGKHVSYICSACCLTVHNNCITLPRHLNLPMHFEHPLFHTYFLGQYEFESLECRICHEELNSNHGGYFCFGCAYVVHVDCAMKNYDYYKILLRMFGGIDVNPENLRPYSVMKETKDGEIVVATEIKHFSHQQHNLILSNEMIKDDKCCDGCVLPISTSYYFCSQCDFGLHKSCAEAPQKKHLWFEFNPHLQQLHSDYIITQCHRCMYETSGFAYKGKVLGGVTALTCLRCSLLSDTVKCQGHEHLLRWYSKYDGMCNACGNSTRKLLAFRCKSCNFTLDHKCLTLPLTTRHKFDEHPFTLTYHDNNNYSECSYCDICEKERNSKHWFYHCAICYSSAHPECVLGKYSFIKLGSICKLDKHPHPLAFVQKVRSYQECRKCGRPACLDLALECKTIGCNYIAHWECIKGKYARRRPFLIMKNDRNKRTIYGDYS